MESEKDIKVQESSVDNQNIISDVKTDASVSINDVKNSSEENDTHTEACIVCNSNNDTIMDNDSRSSVKELLKEIDNKLGIIEASEQYIFLRDAITRNNKLINDCQNRIISVKKCIQYANKYIKDLSDSFLNVIISTEWFDKYYDAVCLFDKAHDSNEAMEWCEAMKDSLDTSIADKDSLKIRVLLNRRMANAVFTLSVKTPYLRLKSEMFNDIRSFISIQSRLFYGWLKNIESISLLLRNYWLDLEFQSLRTETYNKNSDLCFQLGNINGASLSSVVKEYINEKLVQDGDCPSIKLIIKEVDEFENNIDNMLSFYDNQYEQNESRIKYLTDTLLNDYYRKDLEPIYVMYDGIQLSIDSLLAKYEECEEREKWCTMLRNLAEIIVKFLSNQNINLSPELVVGKTHYENDTFEIIKGQKVKFFDFGRIASGTEAPREDLKERVASIRNYGFYRIDSDDNIKIIRETVVSVYN